MARRKWAGVGAEGERRVPLGDPGREAVGEDGNHFAAHRADAVAGIGGERREDVGEPIGPREDVVVGEEDDIAAGFGDGAVAGVVEALLLLENVARGERGGGKLGDDGGGVVRGVVVDDEDFELVARESLPGQTGERLAQKFGAVVGADGDGEAHGVQASRLRAAQTQPLGKRANGIEPRRRARASEAGFWGKRAA